MLLTFKNNPLILISIGLIGSSVTMSLDRMGHFSVMSNDFFLGLCYGIFLGVELLGVFLLVKKGSKNKVIK